MLATEHRLGFLPKNNNNQAAPLETSYTPFQQATSICHLADNIYEGTPDQPGEGMKLLVRTMLEIMVCKFPANTSFFIVCRLTCFLLIPSSFSYFMISYQLRAFSASSNTNNKIGSDNETDENLMKKLKEGRPRSKPRRIIKYS